MAHGKGCWKIQLKLLAVFWNMAAGFRFKLADHLGQATRQLPAGLHQLMTCSDQLEIKYHVLKMDIPTWVRKSVSLLLVKFIDFWQIAEEYFLLVFQRGWDQVD